MDGVAPELNPGRVHRRKNTHPGARHATHELLKSDEYTPTLKYAMPRTSF